VIKRGVEAVRCLLAGSIERAPGFEGLEERTLMSVGWVGLRLPTYFGGGGMVEVAHPPSRAGAGIAVLAHAKAGVVGVAAPVITSATTSTKSVTLTWGGLDSTTKTVTVQRSTDGKTFASLVSLARTTTTFWDWNVKPATTYFYRVVAVGTASSVSSAAVQATTGLLAPTGLAAAMNGAKVTLSWSDPNGGSAGFQVLRSMDGVAFAALGTVAAGTKAFTDTSAPAGKVMYYRVVAVQAGKASLPSNTASIATPAGPQTGATITTRYGNELVVTSPASDVIKVSQSGSTLLVAIGGVVSTLAMPGSLFIYDRGGADSITIDASVTVRATVTALTGAATSVISAGSNVSLWLDSVDAFSGKGTVHWVSSFAGGVSKAAGAALPNPSDAGAIVNVSATLWGSGPVIDDVNQGSVGDCYYLASLAGFAWETPAVLMESAVDMGDGTYAVQFMKSGLPVYVRVSSQLSAGSFDGYKYAHPGASGAVWAPILEKAFAYFRTGANTYASMSGGWMDEAYSALGSKSTSFLVAGSTESAFFSMASADLAGNRPVTLGTDSKPPMLVGGHAYTLAYAWMNAKGETWYMVLNPWGVSGTAYENAKGYATLSFAQLQANFYGGVRAA
jgi:hypothetical protein